MKKNISISENMKFHISQVGAGWFEHVLEWKKIAL